MKTPTTESTLTVGARLLTLAVRGLTATVLCVRTAWAAVTRPHLW